jgi:hypothetical protein
MTEIEQLRAQLERAELLKQQAEAQCERMRKRWLVTRAALQRERSWWACTSFRLATAGLTPKELGIPPVIIGYVLEQIDAVLDLPEQQEP